MSADNRNEPQTTANECEQGQTGADESNQAQGTIENGWAGLARNSEQTKRVRARTDKGERVQVNGRNSKRTRSEYGQGPTNGCR